MNKAQRAWGLFATALLLVSCSRESPEGRTTVVYLSTGHEIKTFLLGTAPKEQMKNSNYPELYAATARVRSGMGCRHVSIVNQDNEGFEGTACNWGERK